MVCSSTWQVTVKNGWFHWTILWIVIFYNWNLLIFKYSTNESLKALSLVWILMGIKKSTEKENKRENFKNKEK